MIDIENKVIDTVSSGFDGVADVSSTFVESPAKLPWVYARQLSNVAYYASYDNALREHHARVTFRLEYYASTKQEVKAMMQIGDTVMQGMKFRRTSGGIVPNYDRNIIRGYADYAALVGEPREIDSNVVYQMYR